jgi:hypothetical protein
MNAKQVIAVLFSLVWVPVILLAKGPTLKITIEGAGLSSPIEITDESVLEKFQVWAGAGNYVMDPHTRKVTPVTEGFIVDWKKGPVGDKQPMMALPQYKVSFHVIHDRPRSYVVFYAIDPATGKGYVYLPGEGEPYWASNVFMIGRRVEGNWLNATDAWTHFAKPTIEQAKAKEQAATK